MGVGYKFGKSGGNNKRSNSDRKWHTSKGKYQTRVGGKKENKIWAENGEWLSHKEEGRCNTFSGIKNRTNGRPRSTRHLQQNQPPKGKTHAWATQAGGLVTQYRQHQRGGHPVEGEQK